jgi:hypothetical protein
MGSGLDKTQEARSGQGREGNLINLIGLLADKRCGLTGFLNGE